MNGIMNGMMNRFLNPVKTQTVYRSNPVYIRSFATSSVIDHWCAFSVVTGCLGFGFGSTLGCIHGLETKNDVHYNLLKSRVVKTLNHYDRYTLISQNSIMLNSMYVTQCTVFGGFFGSAIGLSIPTLGPFIVTGSIIYKIK